MKKVVLIIAFALYSISTSAQHDHIPMSNDKPSIHGMLIFGTEQIYASHLPMFHSPHDYQIILEFELSNDDKNHYLADKMQHPNIPTYTIAPEKFVLPQMVKNPKPFKVNLYRGHFERGGIAILKDIVVSIKQVVYFKKFDQKETKMITANYILFGNNKEQFIAHQISKKPDFEQIIEVKTNISSFLKNKRFSTLKLNDVSNSPIGVSGNEFIVDDVSFQLLEQLYLEFNDLR